MGHVALRAGNAQVIDLTQQPKAHRTEAVASSTRLGQDEFHDREMEQRQLKKLLVEKPTRILVLVGPVSSGKTRLLNHVLVEKWEESGLGAPAIYINGRKKKLETAADLVKALVQPGATWANELLPGAFSMLGELMKRLNGNVKVTLGESKKESSSVTVGLSPSLAAPAAVPSVNDVLDAYLEIIKRYKVFFRPLGRVS